MTGDVAAQPAEGEKAAEHRGGRRNRHRDFGKPREGGAEGAPREGKREENREERGDRREGKGKDERRDKFERKGGGERGGRDRDKGRRDRESGPSHRQYATSANPRDNRAADPNSPFAKLAALKEQLARKE